MLNVENYWMAQGATGLFGWLTGDTQNLAGDLATAKFIDDSALHSKIQDALTDLRADIGIDIPVPKQGTAAYSTYKMLENGGIFDATAKIGFEVAETDMNKVYDEAMKTIGAETNVDWSKFNPPLANTSEAAKVGYAREAYEQAGQQNSGAIPDNGGLEATIPINLQFSVDGDVLVEKTITEMANLTFRNNGKAMW